MKRSRWFGLGSACVAVAALAASRPLLFFGPGPASTARGDAGAPPARAAPAGTGTEWATAPVQRRPAPAPGTPETNPAPPFTQALEVFPNFAPCTYFEVKDGVYLTPVRFVAAYGKDLGLGPLDELREESSQVRDGFAFHLLQQVHDGVPVVGMSPSLRLLGVPGRFVDQGLICLAKIEGRARPALSEEEAIRRATSAVVAEGYRGPIAGAKSSLQYGGAGAGTRLQYAVTLETEAPTSRSFVHLDAMTRQVLYVDHAARPRH